MVCYAANVTSANCIIVTLRLRISKLPFKGNLLYTALCYIFAYSLTQFPMPHQGEILQEAIKNSGISITRIVEELGITRPTIYRKFKEDTVDASFVKRIGEIIGHDFANDFTLAQQTALPFVTSAPKANVTHGVTPRVTPSQPLDLDYAQQLLALQTKYIALLEAYNELLLKVYGPK
jgi:plasmid maintenance system antidote protein VapI